MSGPRGREKRRPESGAIKARYVMVPHPLGGYGEAILKAGGEVHGLPYIEIDVDGGSKRGNKRGASQQEIDKLVEKFRSLLGFKPPIGE